MGHNRINDISTIEGLQNIQHLWLHNNNIEIINSISKLKNLRSLSIHKNKIRDLTPLRENTLIEKLSIHENNITNISPLTKIRSIRSLSIYKNRIIDLSPLSKLTKLQTLDIRNNKISDLSPLKELIKSGREVHLHNETWRNGIFVSENALEVPPQIIVEQGSLSIINYLRDLKIQGAQPLNEAKLIIVGEPGAGKTTLMETLINPDFLLTPETESTLGIEVREGWQFPHPEKPNTNFTANIWDFGGQQIQYMTHQFFLTPGAVYILVSANDRKEPTNFPYWFKIIHLLGEEQGIYSPVLVVLNEKDEKFINKFNFDLSFYRERYPELQISVREVDLSKRDGNYQALRSEIQNMLVQLPHVTKDRPARWEDIRTSLRELSKTKDHIDFAQYSAICSEHQVEREDSQLLFSRYLHRLGSLLHFADDPALYNFIILNPQWAVDAVYSVLSNNKIAKNGGYFTREQIENIWSAKQDNNRLPLYNHDERCKLLNLMEKDNFEICYPLHNNKDIYLAPQLIDGLQPDYEWDSKDCLKFRFQYKFMPEGILTRLVVRLNDIISKNKENKELVWRKGVLFSNDDCEAQVIEEENRDGLKVIDIEVNGRMSERKFFLRDIRQEVQNLHQKWFKNIRSEQMIPCNCDNCTESLSPTYFELSELQQYQDEGENSIKCRNGRIKSIQVLTLLEGVFEEIELNRSVSDYEYHSFDQDLFTGRREVHIHVTPTQMNSPPQVQAQETEHPSTRNELKTNSAPSLQTTIKNKLKGLQENIRWEIIVSLASLFIGTVWATTELINDNTAPPFEPILVIVLSLLTIAGLLIKSR